MSSVSVPVGGKPSSGKRRSLCARAEGGVFLSVVASLLFSAGCVQEQLPLDRREANTDADLKALAAVRAPAPDDPVSLAEAVQLAQKHNLEAVVQQKEREVRAQVIVAERRRMLMDLQANIERTEVDEVQATRSESLLTGTESLEPSISSQKYTTRSDISMAWNLLDFGLTYLQSVQEEDRLRSLEWHIARVRQNLVLDVTRAWCRVAVAQEAVSQARDLATEAEDRMQRLRRLVRRRNLPEVEGLQRQKRLMEIQIRLHEYERRLEEAKAELAQLMGLAPGARFQVAPLSPEAVAALPERDVEAFEREALYNRPELYQGDLQEHIAVVEARKAVLQMLPGVNLFGSYQTSSNRFLYHDEWTEVGADAAWDLMSLPKQMAQVRVARKREALERQRRLAQAVGILAQVHLALLGHQDASERQELAERFAGIQERMHKAQARRLEEGQTTESEVFRARVDAALARIQGLEATAELVVAAARVYNTLGRKPLPDGGWVPHNNRAHDFGTHWTPAAGWAPGAVELYHSADGEADESEDVSDEAPAGTEAASNPAEEQDKAREDAPAPAAPVDDAEQTVQRPGTGATGQAEASEADRTSSSPAEATAPSAADRATSEDGADEEDDPVALLDSVAVHR